MQITAVFVVKIGVLLLTLALALYDDFRERKIKNRVTLPAALAGLVLNLIEHGPTGLLTSFSGWLVPILLLMVFYRINTIGAGDVKLFAAIGAIMGLNFVAFSFMFAVYAGGLVAVVVLVRSKQFMPRMQRLVNYLQILLLTRRVPADADLEPTAAKFIFSWAVTLGTLTQILRVVLGKGTN